MRSLFNLDVLARPRWPISAALLGAAYFAFGQLGLRLQSVESLATFIWAPTGIAMGSLLILGLRFWPVITAAALLVNMSAGAPFWAAGIIAIGNTLEALIAIFILTRGKTGQFAVFGSVFGVLRFAFAAVPVGAAVSATIGTLVVLARNPEAPTQLTWITWWLGDVLGALVVAPFLVTWADPGPAFRKGRAGGLELALFYAGLALVGGLAFLTPSPGHGNLPPIYILAFLAFPFIVWAAARFRAREVTGATLGLSAFVIAGIVTGRGPFGEMNSSEALYFIDVYIALTAATGLLLQAALAEQWKTLTAETLLAREREARIQAEQVNRAKDMFLAVLSHELRTPLTGVLTWAEILRRRADDQEFVRRGLAVIEKCAIEQNRMVDDLLEISRIILGKLNLEAVEFDACAMLKEAVESVSQTAAAKFITIRTDVDRCDPRLVADRLRMKQVIWNLMTNAIRSTPAGGEISLLAETIGPEGERKFRVEVADTGIGIAPEFMGKIFDRFSQADSSLTRSKGGLGLGLAISKRVVELHGGRITARSEGVGKGATFSVEVPMAAGAAVVGGSTRAKLSDLVEDADALAPLSLSGVRVLLVEDDPTSREVISEVLRGAAADVVAVSSATEGLKALLAMQVGVLVSDIAMPQEDGFSFIRKVRSSASLEARCIPALALSALAGPEDVRKAIEGGFDAHLAKPFATGDLTRLIRELSRRDTARAPSVDKS